LTNLQILTDHPPLRQSHALHFPGLESAKDEFESKVGLASRLRRHKLISPFRRVQKTIHSQFINNCADWGSSPVCGFLNFNLH